jgi:hypothetical protein
MGKVVNGAAKNNKREEKIEIKKIENGKKNSKQPSNVNDLS